jgi:hypothetical protein
MILIRKDKNEKTKKPIVTQTAFRIFSNKFILFN